MIYLMAPYSSGQEHKRIARTQLITLILGELMQQFPYDWVFSPITQGHATVPFLPPWVAEDHGFWMRQCEHAVREADRILLLPLPGWKQSKGISVELDWCERMDKPVVLLDCVEWLKNVFTTSTDLSIDYPGMTLLARDYINAHKDLHHTNCTSIVQRYSLATQTILVHTERSEH